MRFLRLSAARRWLPPVHAPPASAAIPSSPTAGISPTDRFDATISRRWGEGPRRGIPRSLQRWVRSQRRWCARRTFWGAIRHPRLPVDVPREEFSAIDPAIHKRGLRSTPSLDIGYRHLSPRPAHSRGCTATSRHRRQARREGAKRGSAALRACSRPHRQPDRDAAYTHRDHRAVGGPRHRGVSRQAGIEKGYTELPAHIKTKAAGRLRMAGKRAAPVVLDRVVACGDIGHVPAPPLSSSSAGRRPDGRYPVGSAGAPARLEGRQGPGRRRSTTTTREDILRRQDRAVRALHEARRRQDRRHA